ncbi:hypothetical protein GC176_24120 [bacterium]|nr:hypothetical protein [bacterium]
MSTFDRIAELKNSDGPQAAIDFLIGTLREEKNYHKLFDALLLKKKQELDLPLVRPTSLDDVPADQRPDFEKYYIDSAREIGRLFLDDGRINEAWLYFRTIQEPDAVAEALADTPLPDDYDKAQELINIALYEGANPIRGLQYLLQSNGTCNTITALDQAIGHFSEDDRRRAAQIMVRHLYDELLASVKSDVDRRMTLPPSAKEPTLRELILGRDWLFQDGNYHIDVSHLNSVVRFARFLNADCSELDLAIQLAQYGAQLEQQYQYPAEPPFDDYYVGHLQYFNLLQGRNVDEAIRFFEQKIAADPDEEDQQMIAYVLVDLLVRTNRLDTAMGVASKHLRFLDEPSFSFPDLCRKSGNQSIWAETAREKGDLVSYTAAIVQ